MQTHGQGDSSVGLTVLRHASAQKSERDAARGRKRRRGNGNGGERNERRMRTKERMPERNRPGPAETLKSK